MGSKRLRRRVGVPRIVDRAEDEAGSFLSFSFFVIDFPAFEYIFCLYSRRMTLRKEQTAVQEYESIAKPGNSRCSIITAPPHLKDPATANDNSIVYHASQVN